MGKTSIEWTDHSWPIVNGCRRASPGCGGKAHVGGCYAERLSATRLSKTPKYRGLAVFTDNGPRWTGESRLWEPHLDMPLRLREPSKIFVADMGDLFYEGNSDEDIAAVFGVMALAPWHTFQVLTKRASRMRAWIERLSAAGPERAFDYLMAAVSQHASLVGAGRETARRARAGYERLGLNPDDLHWPMPWVWLGVSVEDQEWADRRVPELLATPAAVRFVSYEPALGPVDFSEWIAPRSICTCGAEHNGHVPGPCPTCGVDNLITVWGEGQAERLRTGERYSPIFDELRDDGPPLDLVIVGGESGPGARPFDLAWARSVVSQCGAAGVKAFVKQLGAKPFDSSMVVEVDANSMRARTGNTLALKDKKGGDPAEWPTDLRVRELPEVRHA